MTYYLRIYYSFIFFFFWTGNMIVRNFYHYLLIFYAVLCHNALVRDVKALWAMFFIFNLVTYITVYTFGTIISWLHTLTNCLMKQFSKHFPVVNKFTTLLTLFLTTNSVSQLDLYKAYSIQYINIHLLKLWQ